MSDYKLLPCPFCDGDGSMNTNVNAKIVFGSCWDCGARGPVIQYKDSLTDEHIQEAAAAWNTRAHLSRQKGD